MHTKCTTTVGLIPENCETPYTSPIGGVPTEPGMYFYGSILCSVNPSAGPLLDGKGPLFAETFIPALGSRYFYLGVTDLATTIPWRKVELDATGYPLDPAAAHILAACISAGTAHYK